MNLVAAGLVGRALADAGGAGNQARARIGSGLGEGAANVGEVMPVTARDVPAGRRVARLHVLARRHGDRAVDRNLVIVPQDIETAEAEMARKTDGFVVDAFHEAAVAGDHPGLVIDQRIAEHRIQMPLGHRHADGHGQPLPQRAGGGLDARQLEILGVAGAWAAKLAELRNVLESRLMIAGQVQQRIDQHRTVARRKHEAVAVGPFRRGGIIFEEIAEQNRRDIGHTHRHAGVPAVGRLDRIHRQHANGVGKALFCDGHYGRFPLLIAPEGDLDVFATGAKPHRVVSRPPMSV